MRTIALEKDKPHFIQNDTIAGPAIYIYLERETAVVHISDTLSELVNAFKSKLKLEMSAVGLLVQSCVLPRFQTIYKDVYVVGIRDRLKISLHENGESCVNFSRKKFNGNGSQKTKNKISEKYLLETLFNYITSKLDKSKENFLFLSGGKDSSLIALAIAEAGSQNNFRCLTYQSPGTANEVDHASATCTKLGFNHTVIAAETKLTIKSRNFLEQYFKRTSEPTLDAAGLLYPISLAQLPELYNSNMIDGLMNDSYLPLSLGMRQVLLLTISTFNTKLLPNFSSFGSTSLMRRLTITDIERSLNTFGFSHKDLQNLATWACNSRDIFVQDRKYYDRSSLNSFYNDVHTTHTMPELHFKKVRNFCDAFNINLIMPYLSHNFSSYCNDIHPRHKNSNGQNKVFIRKILKDRIGLDSTALGKKALIFDDNEFVLNNMSYVLNELRKCEIWDKEALNKFISDSLNLPNNNSRLKNLNLRLLYLLFMVSAWMNARETQN